MKFLKRIIAIVLLCTFINLLPFNTSTVNADGSITRADIDRICQKYGFSKGKYWTYDYNNVPNNVTDLDAAAKTSFTASYTSYGETYGSKIKSTMHKGEYYYNGYRQCWGFAELLGRELTGGKSPTHSWYHYASASEVNQNGGLQIGDVIHTSGHTAMVISVSGSTFDVIECLGSERSRNKIHVGYFNDNSKNSELVNISNLEWVARYNGSSSSGSTPSDTWINSSCGTSTTVGSSVTLTWGASNTAAYWLHIYKDGVDYYNNGEGSATSWTHTFTEIGTYTCYITPYGKSSYSSSSEGPNASVKITVNPATVLPTISNMRVTYSGDRYFTVEADITNEGYGYRDFGVIYNAGDSYRVLDSIHYIISRNGNKLSYNVPANSSEGYYFVAFTCLANNTMYFIGELTYEYHDPTYSVSVAETSNGSVSLSKTTAKKGEEITVTATPASGYKLDSIKVNGSEISGNTFTMPAGDVTVQAVFAVTIPITTQPKDFTGFVGNTATFKIVAQGTGLKYQWQTYSSGTWVNSSLSGATTATLSVPVTYTRNGYKFRCIVTNANNQSVTSNAATLKVAAPVSITTQPKDFSGAVGSTATFKVAASGTGLKYQWQTYSSGSWKNSSLTGATTATLSVPVIYSRNGYKFRCLVTDSGKNTEISNAATLNVTTTTPVSITTQPNNYTGAVGSTATFKIVASGTGLKYQWQTYSSGAWKNSSLTGYNTATLSVPVSQARNGYKFRCLVTDSGNNTEISNAATLNVVNPVSITTQPNNYTESVGSTATFKVVASGTGLKYQWQTYSSGTWKNSSLTGATTATLSVPVTQARNGYKFRCVVTDSGNKTATSNTVTLTVKSSTPVSITAQPKDYTGPVGATATFSVSAQGTVLKYQWQAYSSGNWVNSSLPGATTSTLSVGITSSRDGYKYRCVVTGSDNSSEISNTASLHVAIPVSITSQLNDYSGPVGSTAIFKIDAQGTGLKYQWQTNASGTWVNSSLPGSTTDTLSVGITSSRDGYKFRCVVTDSANNKLTSNAATLHVTAAPSVSITSQPKDYTGTVGITATFKVTAQGSGLKYQWQSNSSGTWVNSSLSGSNTATLSVPVTQARDGYKFRCVVTDSGNQTATSDAATLHVEASQPAASGVCGDNLTWKLDNTGTLTISGYGDMYGFTNFDDAPWSDYRDNIKAVVFSGNLNSISDFAFLDCYRITSVVIPDSVTAINYGAFANCEGLTNVTFGSGLRVIGEYAFSGCIGLRNIELSNSVTEICYYAFRGCTNLTSIVIPDSVTSIDFGAFEDCDSLSDVYYRGTQAQFEEIYGYDEFPENAVIHFEEVSLEIVSQPSDCLVYVGSIATFKVVAQGTDLSYQWQVNSSGNWVDATFTGSTKDTLSVSVTNSYNGYKFRCIVTDASGESVVSRVATLSVSNSLSPVTINNTSALGVMEADEEMPLTVSDQPENMVTVADEPVDTVGSDAEEVEILKPVSEDSIGLCIPADDCGTEIEMSWYNYSEDIKCSIGCM